VLVELDDEVEAVASDGNIVDDSRGGRDEEFEGATAADCVALQGICVDVC
jgi:hypothetical protein